MNEFAKRLAMKNIGIAIAAPGGYAADERALARGIAALETYGCRVKNYYDPAGKHQRFGGTDEARVAQLHAAAEDPHAHIVLMLRGGYGMSRILPHIDFARLAASGKLFVGHSDFTAFQMAFLASTGGCSFAGPMICDDFTREQLSEFTMRHFWQCLFASEYAIVGQGPDNPVLDLEGMLWGGNLAMLSHLVGTPYFPEIDNGILFVEDIGEHPYRIERMMLQLLHAGVLQRQNAILLGDFSNYRLTDYDNGYDFAAMLAYLRAQLTVPVLSGLPFGHIPDKVTLAVGSRAQLVSDENGFRLTMRGYRSLYG